MKITCLPEREDRILSYILEIADHLAPLSRMLIKLTPWTWRTSCLDPSWMMGQRKSCQQDLPFAEGESRIHTGEKGWDYISQVRNKPATQPTNQQTQDELDRLYFQEVKRKLQIQYHRRPDQTPVEYLTAGADKAMPDCSLTKYRHTIQFIFSRGERSCYSSSPVYPWARPQTGLSMLQLTRRGTRPLIKVPHHQYDRLNWFIHSNWDCHTRIRFSNPGFRHWWYHG